MIYIGTTDSLKVRCSSIQATTMTTASQQLVPELQWNLKLELELPQACHSHHLHHRDLQHFLNIQDCHFHVTESLKKHYPSTTWLIDNVFDWVCLIFFFIRQFIIKPYSKCTMLRTWEHSYLLSMLQLFVDSMALAHFFYIIRVICTSSNFQLFVLSNHSHSFSYHQQQRRISLRGRSCLSDSWIAAVLTSR